MRQELVGKIDTLSSSESEGVIFEDDGNRVMFVELLSPEFKVGDLVSFEVEILEEGTKGNLATNIKLLPGGLSGPPSDEDPSAGDDDDDYSNASGNGGGEDGGGPPWPMSKP